MYQEAARSPGSLDHLVRASEGLSQGRIASGTGVSRMTVRRYIEAARAAELRPGGPEPTEEQIAALATLSLAGPRQAEAPSEEQLAPWAEQSEGWLLARMEAGHSPGESGSQAISHR